MQIIDSCLVCLLSFHIETYTESLWITEAEVMHFYFKPGFDSIMKKTGSLECRFTKQWTAIRAAREAILWHAQHGISHFSIAIQVMQECQGIFPFGDFFEYEGIRYSGIGNLKGFRPIIRKTHLFFKKAGHDFSTRRGTKI